VTVFPAHRRRGFRAAPAVLRMEWAHKSFAAGVPGCSVCARVLRGVKLAVRPAEFVAIAGGAGAGKTTLLLCAAGLMRAELGAVRWGLNAGPPVQRVYATAASMPATHPALLCIDDVRDWPAVCRAVARARSLGAAVVAAGRDPALAAAAGARVFILRDGRLEPFTARLAARLPAHRVAERARRSVDPVARRA